MSSLLTLTFWFNLRPGSMSGLSRNIILAFILLLLVAAITFFILKRKKTSYRQTYNSLYSFSLTNGLIGSLLLFFNYEIVPFFSAYFWYLLWFITLIWWSVVIVIKFIKTRLKKKDKVEIDEIKKYLP